MHVRRFYKVTNVKLFMVRLFVKANKRILGVVKMAIETCDGNLLKFSKEINICRITILNWFNKKNRIDIGKFGKICNRFDLNYLDFINEKQVCSTKSKPEMFCKDWFKL